MNTHPVKLVTIVCEALVRDSLTRLLKDVGAHGFTLFEVKGMGAHGSRIADIEEFANIQIEVVVSPAVAERLLARLEKEFFSRFAIIAYVSDVCVLRPEKF